MSDPPHDAVPAPLGTGGAIPARRPGEPGRNRGPVLVTGAAGALGGSVLARLVAEGRPVLAVDRRPERLEELAARHPAGAVSTFVADLTRQADVEALFEALANREVPRGAAGGGLPGIAHLVGGFRYAPLAEMEDADWSFLWSVNVEVSFRILRQAARLFRRTGGGALVAVSAPAAMLGEAGVGAYAAGKAAVLRLVESLARETAAEGGRANAVLPGTMDTPANRRDLPDADPAGWVTPDEVASTVAWLLGDGSRGVNGAAVRVPGPTL